MSDTTKNISQYTVSEVIQNLGLFTNSVSEFSTTGTTPKYILQIVGFNEILRVLYDGIYSSLIEPPVANDSTLTSIAKYNKIKNAVGGSGDIHNILDHTNICIFIRINNALYADTLNTISELQQYFPRNFIHWLNASAFIIISGSLTEYRKFFVHSGILGEDYKLTNESSSNDIANRLWTNIFEKDLKILLTLISDYTVNVSSTENIMNSYNTFNYTHNDSNDDWFLSNSNSIVNRCSRYTNVNSLSYIHRYPSTDIIYADEIPNAYNGEKETVILNIDNFLDLNNFNDTYSIYNIISNYMDDDTKNKFSTISLIFKDISVNAITLLQSEGYTVSKLDRDYVRTYTDEKQSFNYATFTYPTAIDTTNDKTHKSKEWANISVTEDGDTHLISTKNIFASLWDSSFRLFELLNYNADTSADAKSFKFKTTADAFLPKSINVTYAIVTMTIAQFKDFMNLSFKSFNNEHEAITELKNQYVASINYAFNGDGKEAIPTKAKAFYNYVFSAE